ncbi:MAG: hypothetical protein N5P05_004490 (plasmid) [Chroococcopsis gigantea SAG 12.99]|jgi:hypothetical protein|nr:hypothetical protein [Chroococcopsis gigantea SAG 12.99]
MATQYQGQGEEYPQPDPDGDGNLIEVTVNYIGDDEGDTDIDALDRGEIAD